MFLNLETKRGCEQQTVAYFTVLKYFTFPISLEPTRSWHPPLASPPVVEDQLKPHRCWDRKEPSNFPWIRGTEHKYHVTVAEWDTQSFGTFFPGPQGVSPLFGHKPPGLPVAEAPPDPVPSRSSVAALQRALPTHMVCSGLFFKVHVYPFPQLLPLLRGLVQFMLQSFNFLQRN